MITSPYSNTQVLNPAEGFAPPLGTYSTYPPPRDLAWVTSPLGTYPTTGPTLTPIAHRSMASLPPQLGL